MSFQTIVFIVAMILGALLIVAVAVRYWKQGTAGLGGAGLAVIGVLCIGLSLWSTIEIEAGDVKLKLNTLADQLDAVTAEMAKSADSQEQTKNQVIQLAGRMQSALPAAGTEFRDIRTQLERIPSVDRQKLEGVRHQLKLIR